MIGIVTLRDSIYDETGPKDIVVGKVTREDGMYKVTESNDKYYVVPLEGVVGICYTSREIVWETEDVEE